ncbi:hypothetical protein ACFODZ_16305 [Marinicella sediminis]|uniref:Phosphatidate cytidylyltransferase n=1 Tax=Marinicella sediminis TaxID=1792834 RepID=A0ABV7JHV1_9GAMM|nr:hypothetical protein [Marinicella sediminis]
MSQRVIVLLILALFAIILYIAGFQSGSVAVIILAAAVEVWFWLKLLIQDKRKEPPAGN